MQSTWPRVGDGALSAPLFADKQVGLGALSSDPWIQQLSVDRTLFPYAMEGCGPQPCSLSVCVSNAMHFPVVINPLGTKPSNNGCSVPGPELDLQSPVCSSLRGSWL